MKRRVKPFKEEGEVVIKGISEVLSFYKINIQSILIICLIAIGGYAWGLNGDYIKGDTTYTLVNPTIQDFSKSLETLNLNTIFISLFANLPYSQPFYFHASMLTLHVVNSLLVFYLAYLYLGKRYSLISAVIFSVLPAGSEAVFWITGIGYLQNAFFGYLAIILSVIYTKTKDKKVLLFALGVFLLSLLLLKSTWMLTIPFIIFSLDFFNGRSGKTFSIERIKTKWWYLLFILSIAVFWFFFLRTQYTTRVSDLVTDYYYKAEDAAPMAQRIPYTIGKTFELYVFPYNLSFYHEEPVSMTVFWLMVVFTFLLVCMLVYLLIKRSLMLGLILAIISSILPTFSPVQVAWFVADRYLYLGGAFFAMLLSFLIVKVSERVRVNNLSLYITGVLLLLYVVRLFYRADDFKDSKSLWLATQRTDPHSYRVYNNLGDEYTREQNWERAIASFSMSIKLNPDFADAYHNLGLTYMLMNDYENAEIYLLESYNKNPRLYQALIKLAYIEKIKGDTEKSKEYADKALEINPDIDYTLEELGL